MERSKVLFRQTVGGYNKQDVNNYIAKLSQDFEAERRGLQGQLSELSAQLEAQKKLGSESNNMSERLAWLEDKLAQAEALVAAQSEQLDARGSELEELRQVCDRIAIVSGGRIAGILPASDSSEDFGMLMVSQVK